MLLTGVSHASLIHASIAATAVGLLGKESDILRRVLKWSVGLLLAMCVLVYLQSNVLSWMIP